MSEMWIDCDIEVPEFDELVLLYWAIMKEIILGRRIRGDLERWRGHLDHPPIPEMSYWLLEGTSRWDCRIDEFDWSGNRVDDITHWMPLPNVPNDD